VDANAPRDGGGVRARRRLQRDPRTARRALPRSLDARCAVPAGDARHHRSLLNLGLTDAFRACEPGEGHYTFWDYQAGSWQKNDGIRIDHMLLSPQAADHLAGAVIEKRTRGWEKPSDHVPVVIDLDF
jgi:exodeoxyribonuclease-3